MKRREMKVTESREGREKATLYSSDCNKIITEISLL